MFEVCILAVYGISGLDESVCLCARFAGMGIRDHGVTNQFTRVYSWQGQVRALSHLQSHQRFKIIVKVTGRKKED